VQVEFDRLGAQEELGSDVPVARAAGDEPCDPELRRRQRVERRGIALSGDDPGGLNPNRIGSSHGGNRGGDRGRRADRPDGRAPARPTRNPLSHPRRRQGADANVEAALVHASTLELLDELGVGDQLVEEGNSLS
jgi:hypothetical protein